MRVFSRESEVAMGNLTLAGAIIEIASPSARFGVWAEGELTWDSENYRIGQLQFENGGLADDKVLVITAQTAQDAWDRWIGIGDWTKREQEDFLASMTREEMERDFFSYLWEQDYLEDAENELKSRK